MRTYDALRRLVSVENPAEEVVTYGHDEFGRMTSFTDGRAKEWTYTYDEFGRRVRETDPDSNYTELTYGTGFSGGCGCGGSSTNVAQIRRQDASIVSFEYDLAGRLLLVDYNSIGGGGSDEITYAYDLSSRVTSVVDTRLNLGDETYAFTYDEADVSHTRQSLVKVRHPEGYTQEFFYDADGHLEAYKDVDGNISENTYDAYGRLDTLTDAYGDVTSWAYAVPADTTYPVGAVKLQTYGNDAKNAYTYGDLGRLERIDHKNSSNSVMDYIELAYDPAGLITSKARSVSGGYTTHYAYDDAYRLIEEDNKNGSSVSKSKRSYEYDAAGNRISMTQWNDASVNDTTEYTYGNREQILDAEPYNYDGTTSSGDNDYTFDSRGNMTSRAWEPGGTGHLTEYDWNEDNRLIEVTEWTDQEPPEDDIGESLGFHYDYQGRRLLKRGPWVTLEIGPTIERERYFFHGLTEDIKKVSVDGAHADSAFEFATKEDGISASEWKATNASVTSTNSTSRRSDVIALDGVAPPVKMSFMIGDTSGTGSNPNDVAWDSTKRTLSFWQQGGFSKLQVLLTSSAGEKKVTYNTGTGINGHTGNNVEIYLGTTGSTSWQRFERNIEADYETYAGGATWTNTDGLNILPDATYGSYDMNIDDIRLSNSLTSEHNTLGPGSIAHILRHRKIDPTTHAVTDRWFHYDQVGSVMNESNVAGTLEATHHQDAFGNVEVAWDSGVWDAGVSGWHHNTKEIDGAARLTYMYQRWYVDHLGSFHSRAPLPPIEEAPFGFAGGNPVMAIDPDGRVWWWILLLLGGAAGATGCGGSGPPPEPPDPCHWKFNGQTFDVPDEVMSSDGCKKYALEVEKGAPRTFNQNLYDAAELNCLKCAYNRAVARDEAEDRKD
jgi:RHS repeat-associated protein